MPAGAFKATIRISVDHSATLEIGAQVSPRKAVDRLDGEKWPDQQANSTCAIPSPLRFPAPERSSRRLRCWFSPGSRVV
ncbi:MAG: hypothetical protein KAI66_14950 [Lentisphaeria bacterium]|nr:hypothetical protein [Lentisphaeria bacterium]